MDCATPWSVFFVLKTNFGVFFDNNGGFQTFPAGYVHSFWRESEVQNAQFLQEILKISISSVQQTYV